MGPPYRIIGLVLRKNCGNTNFGGGLRSPPPRQFRSSILATKIVISHPFYRSTRLNKNVVLERHGRFRQLMDPRQSDVFGSNSAVIQSVLTQI